MIIMSQPNGEKILYSDDYPVDNQNYIDEINFYERNIWKSILDKIELDRIELEYKTNMPSLSTAKYDLSRLSRENFLFWGNISSGKSWATASFPKPMLILDFDMRINSLISCPWAKETGVDYEQFPNLDAAALRMNQLYDNKGEKYRTIVLDSLTYFSESIITHSMDHRQGDGKKIGSWKIADIGDYGSESSVLMQAIQTMVDLPVISIVTGHYTETETKDVRNPDRVIRTRTLLTGAKKIAAKIPGAFNEIYSFYVQRNSKGDPEYLVNTFNDGETFARTTIPGLPKIINQTNTKLYDVLKQTVEANNPE